MDISGALRAIIFSAFHGFKQRRASAREERDDAILGPTKRRPQFHAIEESESARRARAGVNQTPARRDAGRGGIHGAREVRGGGVDDLRRVDWVSREGADQIRRRITVEIGVLAAGSFRVQHRCAENPALPRSIQLLISPYAWIALLQLPTL